MTGTNEQLLRELGELRGRIAEMEASAARHESADRALRFTHRLLEMANRHAECTALLREVVGEIQDLTECAAVGIRLLDPMGNMPYAAHVGFPESFCESENAVSTETDRCISVNVVQGQTDPRLPFYTEAGSFYINQAERFLAAAAQEGYPQTRDVGHQLGHESVMMVPIRAGNRILGLIHAADPRENMAPLETVQTLEAAAGQLGMVILRMRAEEESHQARTFLQTIVDAIPEITLVIDRDYRVILANRAAREQTGGIDPVAACLTCYKAFRHRETPCLNDVEFCPLKKIMETNRPVTTEHTHFDAEGNEVYVEIFAAPIFDEQGEVVQVIQASRDVTKQKRMDEQLRNEMDISEATLKSLPGIFYGFDDQGKFFRWNENFEKVSGYSADEILGMHPLDFIAAPDREHIADKIQEVFTAGEAAAAAGFLSRDGREIPFLFTGVRCEIDGKLCLLGTGIDVSERKHAQEALQQSEERFRSLVETTSDWIWEVNAEGVYTYASPRSKDLLGYEPEEIIGKTPFDLMPPDEAERIASIFRTAVDRRQPLKQVENTNLDKRGWPVVLETSAMPILDPMGKLEGYRGIDRDVTERKQVEQERVRLIKKLESQNSELERFTYTVSHDLKSPLITISGYLGILAQDIAGGEQEQIQVDMDHIATAAKKMHTLLSELLELSRVGRVVNPPEDVAMEDLARDAIELVGGEISRRGVQVVIAPDLPVLHGDRTRLLEVFQNLVANAVKWMGDQGEPRIDIGARSDDGETVCFVRDNGIGINPKYHEKIFGLFEKLDAKSQGTGVGLALAKRIVEVHGGRIWVESEGNAAGSVFCFTIAPKGDSAHPVELASQTGSPEKPAPPM